MGTQRVKPPVDAGASAVGIDFDPDGADAILRRLELLVRNKLDGLLQGNYLGLVPGPGSEAGESRMYVPGDDVRFIDWPVTARTTVTHVRQTIADRELETWLVVDLSPSLDFGTARTRKRELVLAAISSIVTLVARQGNRVGAIVCTGEETLRIPAAGGTLHARRLVRQIAAVKTSTTGTRGDLAAALELVRRPPRRRGLVAVVSDFLGGITPDGRPDWERPLRALRARHELLAVEILDPREMELPAAGLLTFLDPETGQQLEVQTSKKDVRDRYQVAALAQRAQIAASIRHAGAGHLQLRTDEDWIDSIVRFVLARRTTSGASGRGRAAAPTVGVVR
jgi:uncharacterized protein (DUF58 family)